MRRFLPAVAALVIASAAIADTFSLPPNGQLPGTTTNDNANTGNVGEYVSSAVAQPGVSLTTGTDANLTSLSLTAGDWDIECTAIFLTAGSTSVTGFLASISASSAGLDFSGGVFAETNIASYTPGAINFPIVTPRVRKSIASTTTFYCVSRGNFGTSTLTVWGLMRARRVR